MYVRDAHNGFIVNVGDIENLAARQARLIENEDMRREFGAKGRETAVQQLDTEHCARRHLDAYSHIVEGHAIVE